jgi:hypothetical protein
VFARHFEAYRSSHAPHLSRQQRKVARDLVACRTATLGGHLEICAQCGFSRPAYNSCRNRHCPKCQALRQARWVENRMQRVLPVHHFHVVFTLPPELAQLAPRNPATIYALLMRAAAESLLDLARDKRFWGKKANPGITAVLHTWSRDLRLHPHVHCIVTGGGLCDDGTRWISAPSDFLFPVHVLGALFRGKVLAGIEHLRKQGMLRDPVSDRAARRRRQRLHKKSWVVYCKRPFGGPAQVFHYLGRYTHRVAISNTRIVSVTDDAVIFRTRGHATATLHSTDFIARFLQHVLPPGFVKIRHFGLLASVNVKTRLAQAQQALLTQNVDVTRSLDAKDDQGPLPQIVAEPAWPIVLLALPSLPT